MTESLVGSLIICRASHVNKKYKVQKLKLKQTDQRTEFKNSDFEIHFFIG